MNDDVMYGPGVEQWLDDLERKDPERYDAVVAAITFILERTETARSQAQPFAHSTGRRLWATVVQYEITPVQHVIWWETTYGPTVVGIGSLS